LARVDGLNVDYADHPTFLNYVGGELHERAAELTDRPPLAMLEPTGSGAITTGGPDGA
jgi:hypothetical protein